MTSAEPAPAPPPGPSPGDEVRPPEDLGLGPTVARKSRGRLLSRDGRFLIHRVGLGFFESWSAYHWIIGLSWPRFLALLASAFVATNLLFATAFTALGPEALAFPPDDPLDNHFLQAFFFSVETLATIGYGHVSPRGLPANLLLTAEAMLGMLGLALTAGMVFTRFAQPEARIRFSQHALLAPYRDGLGLMFRMVNLRRGELLEVEVQVNLSWRPPGRSGPERDFHELPLERSSVVFFPLSWTVVHPIGPGSPLHGVELDALRASGLELFVYVKALDEGSGQGVRARTSYGAEDIRSGVRFVSIVEVGDDGAALVDVRRLDETTPADGGGMASAPLSGGVR